MVNNQNNKAMTNLEITFCKAVAELVKAGMDVETAKAEVKAMMNFICDKIERQ